MVRYRVLRNQVGNMANIKFTNDIISDVLTRVRNAIGAKKDSVLLPNTKIVLEILKVLSNNKFIGSYSVDADNQVLVELKIEGEYKFSDLQRVSKPGIRRYIASSDIRPVKGGKGLAIISTSKGVMSGYQAFKQGVGGEFLCKIW